MFGNDETLLYAAQSSDQTVVPLKVCCFIGSSVVAFLDGTICMYWDYPKAGSTDVSTMPNTQSWSGPWWPSTILENQNNNHAYGNWYMYNENT